VGGGLKDKLVVGPTPVVAVQEASDFSTAVGRPTPSNSVIKSAMFAKKR
jgi:hypothetical protein